MPIFYILFVILGITFITLILQSCRISVAKEENVAELLAPLLEQYNVPALGGLLLNTTGVVAFGVVGQRKLGYSANVTSRDFWHLGSDTKAMTSTMIASLVENGIFKWNATIGEVFPMLSLPSEYEHINILHLLSHRSGIPANANWSELSTSAPTLIGQRLNSVKILETTELLARPGERFIYSNWGYVVAAAMVENITGESYENLMSEHVFEPLEMESASYGPTSGSNELTQPWGHTEYGHPLQIDNPLVMSPAGTVHCSLEDWAKFIIDQLRGALGLPALLSPDSYTSLHASPFNGTYALGWNLERVGWIEGPVLQHAGSNTLNYANVIIDVTGRKAMLAVCNKGDTYLAVDAAIRLISNL